MPPHCHCPFASDRSGNASEVGVFRRPVSRRRRPSLPAWVAPVAAAGALVACSSDASTASPSVTPTLATDDQTAQTAPPTDVPSTTAATNATTTAATTAATTTIVSTTTTSAVPMPPTIDFATGAIGGYAYLSPSDGLVEEFTSSLRTPTSDTDWRPVPVRERCSFNDEYRYVTWGDLQFLLERAPDQDPIVAGWALGDRTILGPTPPDRVEAPATGLTSDAGVGLGSAPTNLDVAYSIFNSGRLLVIDGVPVYGSIEGGTIADLFSGPLDCPALDLSEFTCTRPIPIRTLPDGTPASDVSRGEGLARWGVDTAGPNGENVVTQILAGPEPTAAQAARNAAIGAQIEPLDVRVVAADDPSSEVANVFVFDSGTDCVRLLQVGPGLDAPQLQEYAGVLADELEERR